MKKCGKWKVLKLLSEFSKETAAKDGLMYCCRLCNYKKKKVAELQGTEQDQEAKTVIDKFIETKTYTKDDLLVDDASQHAKVTGHSFR